MCGIITGVQVEQKNLPWGLTETSMFKIEINIMTNPAADIIPIEKLVIILCW